MSKGHIRDVLTVAEVAALWGISRRTVHRYIAAGRLKAVKLPGGDYRIARSDLDAALNKAAS